MQFAGFRDVYWTAMRFTLNRFAWHFTDSLQFGVVAGRWPHGIDNLAGDPCPAPPAAPLPCISCFVCKPPSRLASAALPPSTQNSRFGACREADKFVLTCFDRELRRCCPQFATERERLFTMYDRKLVFDYIFMTGQSLC